VISPRPPGPAVFDAISAGTVLCRHAVQQPCERSSCEFQIDTNGDRNRAPFLQWRRWEWTHRRPDRRCGRQFVWRDLRGQRKQSGHGIPSGAIGDAPCSYSFAGSPSEGARPSYGSLIADAAANLYGTTALGGTSGSGTVFKLALAADFNGIAYLHRPEHLFQCPEIRRDCRARQSLGDTLTWQLSMPPSRPIAVRLYHLSLGVIPSRREHR
jgi:uncharacterized repeat protein (TIGR03803 family)